MSKQPIRIPEIQDNDYSFSEVVGKLTNNIKNIDCEFNKIKDYFNKLNQDKSHFINSNDICTPIDCVKEMVDSIPKNFWKKEKLMVLDPCCGNGNFHAYIQTKTKLSNLYFNEINQKRIDNLMLYFGNNINITKKDYLLFDDTTKYDLIVANPPYAKFMHGGQRASKNHNLSREFIKKSLSIVKDNGYILFIVPDNWMSFSDRNILPREMSNYQFLHINIHGAKKYFPKVGSSFTWFLLQKKENKEKTVIENNYIIKENSLTYINKHCKFIPLFYNNIVKNILDKTIYNEKAKKFNIETTSFLHRYTKAKNINENKDDKFCYKLIHTPSQTVYSDIPHKFQDGHKVFISLTNQYSTFIDKCGMTQSIAFIKCKNKNDALLIKNELDQEIYKFLNNIGRYGNFNNIRILQSFPRLHEINLTQEELEFINHFNSKYYHGKKK